MVGWELVVVQWFLVYCVWEVYGQFVVGSDIIEQNIGYCVVGFGVGELGFYDCVYVLVGLVEYQWMVGEYQQYYWFVGGDDGFE